MKFTVTALGNEVLAARFRKEIVAFKREQRVQMRKAGNLVKKETVATVKSKFRITRPRGSGRQEKLGPLHRKIRLRLYATKVNVGARIEPNRLGFYGRYLETGLNAVVTRHQARNVFIGGRWVRLKAGSYNLRIPRKPYLEPVFKSTLPRVVDIMGDSYNVFYRGGGGA